MKINKKKFQEALEIVKPGLANKEIIEQSTSFAFINGHVITYNDKISIRHPVDGLNIEGAISAEQLYQLLRKSKSEEITLRISDNQAIIKSGKSKAGLVLESEIKLPLKELPDTFTWKKLPDDFTKGLSFVYPFASNDMSRPTLTCIDINQEGFLQTSDNLRIAQYRFEKKLPVQSVLLPSEVAKVIAQLPISEVAVNKEEKSISWIHFRTDKGTIISCRIFNDKFPDTSRFLNIEGNTFIMPDNITEIIDRASIFTNKETTFSGDIELITIDILKGKLIIQAKSEIGNWFKETADLDYEGIPITFMINPIAFRDILRETKDFILQDNRIKFSGENWDYMTLIKFTTDNKE